MSVLSQKRSRRIKRRSSCKGVKSVKMKLSAKKAEKLKNTAAAINLSMSGLVKPWNEKGAG